MNALTFSRFGGPEVLEDISIPKPTPAAGEVLVEMKAIGLNYADIYRRQGNYHLVGEPPYLGGYEGSGVVVEIHSGDYAIGDRVAFADVPLANAEFVVVPAEHIIPLPENTSFKLAASILLQGLTAQYLSSDSHAVQAGETVLIHAAAGGVGQLLTQMCCHKGARVIGLSRSEEKLEIIRECGADEAIVLDDRWVEKVLVLTKNSGVDAAYDSVGATLVDTFKVTRDCGHVVFYGMSGGDPESVDPRMLMDTSKTLTGGDLWSYLTSREERQRRASRLFDWVKDGKITVKPAVEFALSDGVAAHEYLQSGKCSGKVLLLPDTTSTS